MSTPTFKFSYLLRERWDMISDNQSICPKCGGQLKYYDNVQRLIRTKFGNKKRVAIRRLRCCKCHAVHRELPDFISMRGYNYGTFGLKYRFRVRSRHRYL